MLGGVCGAVSSATGIDATWVRIGFVLLAIGSGIMVLVYAAAWLLIPMEGETSNIYARAINDRRGIRLIAAVLIPLLIALSVITSILHVGFVGFIGWPTFLAIGVFVLIWRNANESEKAFIDQDVVPLLGVDTHGEGRRRLMARVALGVLVGAGGIVLLVDGHTTAAALRPVGGAALVIAASVIIFGPWWLSLVRDLIAERQARALAEERAQMAAHVHDSVLQTLALIQRVRRRPAGTWCAWPAPRSASCGPGCSRAGRRGAIGEDATMLGEGVGLLQRQVEADHGITVQVVMVGDCALDDGLRALLDAAREATVNAAKWSGADQVSVYAEVEADSGHALRAGPGSGLRPRGGSRGPPGHRPVHPGPDEPVRGRGRHPLGTGGGGRGPALHAPSGAGPVTAGAAGPPHRADPGRPPRIFLVEDHAVFRAGVRAELGEAVEVIGEADEAGAAVELINERLPEVVLLDVHLPGGGGHAVLRGVLPHHPEVQFLALSVSDAPEDVIEVIRAGARGYVTKTISGPELLQAVYRVAAGDAVFSPRLAGFVLDAFAAGWRARHRPRPRARPAVATRARGPAPDRPGLHLQGGRPRPEHLGQDGRIARLVGAAQAAALDSPRTDQVGHGQALGLDKGVMREDLADEHRDAALLAQVAGRALMELRADPPALRDIGAAGDRMSHQLLVRELARLYPGDDVRSEEGLEHVAGEGRLWIVDPLDGTREFRQAGRTDWAVHVAMALGGVAVVGAVALPALDLVLSTGEPPVLPPASPGERPRVVVSRSRPPDVAYDVTERTGWRHGPDGFGRRQDRRRDPRGGRRVRARRRPVRVGLVRPGGGGDGKRSACQPARRGAAALRRARRLAARSGRVPPGVCGRGAGGDHPAAPSVLVGPRRSAEAGAVGRVLPTPGIDRTPPHGEAGFCR